MTAHILRVAVPSPLYRYFDYLTPAQIESTDLRPGIRVRVPFGHICQVAILLEVRNDSPMPLENLRPALEVLDSEPILSAELMQLALWATRYYHHPPGEVFASLLPTLLRKGKPAHRKSDPLWRISAVGRRALAEGAADRAPRQRACLDYLLQHPAGIFGTRLRQDLPGWSSTVRALQEKDWIEKVRTNPGFHYPLSELHVEEIAPELNTAQADAVAAVCRALDGFAAFLLDGVTGSGKTEVYLRIVETVLARGGQALILVPEIGLTPQLLSRVQSRLPGPLAVLHSGLGEQERLNAWILAGEGLASVVIGTRSAIFTPFRRLGVIIIDEEHDLSFKQQEGFRYSARDLALVRARQAGIPVLLGSATPSLESLYNTQRGRYQELRLPERVGNAAEPPIDLLDVRRQPMEAGLSAPLQTLMRNHLDREEQVLLFLNRRGFAPTLICHECGWVSQCQRCDARMTLHLNRHRLVCHHCGAERSLDRACPDCGSIDVRALGQGTERIEKVLQREFPDQGIARIDRDSTRRKGSLQTLLEDAHSGQCHILLGTQMLAKGHHFPNVTLVGIVDADQGLFAADFRASERMAQLIIQVAGRAGRAEKPGRVVIQTHHPHHPLLQKLVHQGYPAFASAALTERLAANLPPFSCQALLRAEAVKPDPPLAFLQQALTLGQTLNTQGIDLLDPIPALMERRAGRYRAQLLIQSPTRTALQGFLDGWVGQLADIKLARKVRWSLDVDPVDF